MILQPANGEGPLAELIARAKAVAPADLWVKLDTTGATPEALSLRLINLVVVHEYGHVLAARSGAARIKWGTTWFQEFVASYLMYAFLRSKHPDEADYYDAWDRLVLYEAKNPLTRVAQWDAEPQLSADQRLWYYAATGDRVRRCYARSGLGLIREFQRALAGTPKMRLPDSELLSILEQSCPGFQQWAEDMRSDRPGRPIEGR